MQKVYNTLSVLSFLGVAFAIFMLFRMQKSINSVNAKLSTPPVPTNGNGRNTITGRELWNGMQDKIKEMKVDVTFDNNNI